MYCERLIALLMSVTDPRAHCYDLAHAICTQKCGLLCLTSFPELDIPHSVAFQYQPAALTLRCCARDVHSIFIFQMKKLRPSEVQ